jgi:hypothetical protein
MARRSRIPKRYRYRFKGYTFKLTYKQKDRMERCAKLQGLTSNKLIKAALQQYLDRYQGMIESDALVADNQLTLFNVNKYGRQLSLMDEITLDEEE